jgi:hypothetical protein
MELEKRRQRVEDCVPSIGAANLRELAQGFTGASFLEPFGRSADARRDGKQHMLFSTSSGPYPFVLN